MLPETHRNMQSWVVCSIKPSRPERPRGAREMGMCGRNFFIWLLSVSLDNPPDKNRQRGRVSTRWP